MINDFFGTWFQFAFVKLNKNNFRILYYIINIIQTLVNNVFIEIGSIILILDLIQLYICEQGYLTALVILELLDIKKKNLHIRCLCLEK